MKRLSESVWGDLRKKSLGQETRIEEDVNHMDFDTFADYIKYNYSEKGDWFSVNESEDGKSRHIEIDIISGINLSFNVVDGKIYNILIQSNNKYVDVPGLKKVFNVNVLGSSTFSVVEKDWTKSNNTFVKLIEFFLEKKTNESVWGDLRKKSLGQETRKEDDINNLSSEGFYEYLMKEYEGINGYNVEYAIALSVGHRIIRIILYEDVRFKIEYSNKVNGWDYAGNNKIYGVIDRFNEIPIQLSDEMVRELKKFMEIKEIYQPLRYIIYPKDGVKGTNKFYVDVLDILLEKFGESKKDSMCLKKKR